MDLIGDLCDNLGIFIVTQVYSLTVLSTMSFCNADINQFTLHYSYIIPRDSEALQHGCNVLEDLHSHGGVAYPHHMADLIWAQRVSQQDPGQQHRPLMRNVAKCQQQLVHLL